MDRAHQQAYDILAEHRDYLDKLAEMLLDKETLRRPDLEGIFEGIEPRAAFDVFPNEDDRFPRQADREPVKTPAELAKERGEELPPRMTLVEASRAARERRLAGQGPQPTGEIGFNFGQHAGDKVDSEKNTFFAPEEKQAEKPAQPAPAPETPAGQAPSDRPTTEIPRVGGRHAKPQPDHDQWSSFGENQRANNPYNAPRSGNQGQASPYKDSDEQ